MTSDNNKENISKIKYHFRTDKELNNLGHLMTVATIIAGLFVSGALILIEVAPNYPFLEEKQILIDDTSVFYYPFLKSIPGLFSLLEGFLPNYFNFLLIVLTFSFLIAFLSIIMFLIASYDIDRPHEFIVWKKHGQLLLTICMIISTIFLPYSILRFATNFPTELVFLFLILIAMILGMQRFYWKIRRISHKEEDFQLVEHKSSSRRE